LSHDFSWLRLVDELVNAQGNQESFQNLP